MSDDKDKVLTPKSSLLNIFSIAQIDEVSNQFVSSQLQIKTSQGTNQNGPCCNRPIQQYIVIRQIHRTES